ncbi:MAG: hypothetical protein JWM64_1328 [Frankiales bacterium]|nr:hypothetical protein [Frankiales bacterium]
MKALVRAELLKLSTVRLPVTLLLVTLLLATLSVCATVLTAGRDGAPLEKDDPQLFAVALSSASAGQTVLLVLGILVLTQEFRFGTATPSFLVTPKRERVLAAKLVAVALVGVLFAAVSVLWTVGLTVVLMRVRGIEPDLDGPLLEVLTGIVLVLVLYGPIGIAVGALVRNQVAAVVGALAYLFVVEQLLVALLPDVGRWLPGGASAAVLQLGDLATTRGDLLSPLGGALLLVAYAVGLSAVAARLTLRRDLV